MKRTQGDWRCSPVIEHLLGISKILDCMPSIAKNKEVNIHENNIFTTMVPLNTSDYTHTHKLLHRH